MSSKQTTKAAAADAELRRVMANMNKEIAGIKARSLAGLLEVGLLTERESKARVPREYGLLSASGYTQKAPESTDTNPQVEVGFTSDYAVYVHENLEAKLRGKKRPSGIGTYWSPDGEPRYLAKAVEVVTPKVIDVMKKHSEIPDGGTKK